LKLKYLIAIPFISNGVRSMTFTRWFVGLSLRVAQPCFSRIEYDPAADQRERERHISRLAPSFAYRAADVAGKDVEHVTL
jgi:hypothetical protein